MNSVLAAVFGVLAPAAAASLLFGGVFGHSVFGIPPSRVSSELRGRLAPAPVRASYPGALPRARSRVGGVQSLGVELTAVSAIAVDAETGEVLFQKNPDMVWPTASLTKLMTALQLRSRGIPGAEQLKLESSDEGEGGIPYFIPGEEVSEQELFQAMLVGSANSAATALARSSGGIEAFIAAMNDRARALGLSSTHFVDPTGLNPENVSTARNMAILARAAFADEVVQEAASAPVVTVHPAAGSAREIRSTNALLSGFLNNPPYRIIAGKTGHLDESRYNLALELERGGRRVTIVLFGSETAERRFQEAKAVAAWLFNDLRAVAR
jgi:D-alanyl-D-alanine endopeptidase (penicillin-binding protein 7)